MKIESVDERKFLVPDFPEAEVDGHVAHNYSLGYTTIGPDGAETSIRKEGFFDFSVTVKSGGLKGSEWETRIDRDQFKDLWPSTEGRRLEIVRYKIPFDRNASQGLVAVLDFYKNTGLAGLMTVQVEFVDDSEANGFEPLGWFGAEVTSDPRYKNQQLAVNGIPEIN